ncbi:MAG: RusA family crossover junction endodeoxyribonuclease, partial [Lutibacter sp.]
DLPPTVNHYLAPRRGGGYYKTQEARIWESTEGYKLKRKCEKFGKAKVEVFIEYYFKDDRSDVSNRTKILHDLLQEMGIVDNDRQIYANHEFKNIDPTNPRVEIEVLKFEKSNSGHRNLYVNNTKCYCQVCHQQVNKKDATSICLDCFKKIKEEK